AVVLARAHDHVAGARVLRDRGPLVRVEAARPEPPRELDVVLVRRLLVVHPPDVTPVDGVQAPVDEDSEAGIAEPRSRRCRGRQQTLLPFVVDYRSRTDAESKTTDTLAK